MAHSTPRHRLQQLSQQAQMRQSVARELQQKKDSTWEYVEQTSQRTRQYLMEMIGSVTEVRAFLLSANAYGGEAVVLINALEVSIENASQAWKNLCERHIGKTGPATSDAEFMQILDIGTSYIQLTESLLSEHSLTASRLSEIVKEVELALATANNDTQTVSDAVIVSEQSQNLTPGL